MSGIHVWRSYRHIDSPVHRAPAAAKLGGTLALVTALALVPVGHFGVTAAAFTLVIALASIAKIPLSAFLARLAIVQPFILGVAVLSLFQGRGLVVFGAVALKSTACVAAVQLLAHTTQMDDILTALRRAGAPSSLVLTLALLHRYLFVLVDESQRMARARCARTWQSSRWVTWKAHASVIAVSFVRSVARADRITAAMRARGWS
ncbi:MAG: energy-coupling factor transporter transmembrane component T family protein [Polyangiaceae bacterium]